MTALLLPANEPSVRQRWLLLAGQAFFFGITLAMLIVSGSAIFLDAYGAGRLPWVYIAVALLGALLSARLTVLQRRWTLLALAINTTGGLMLLTLFAWLALRFAQMYWVAFILLIIFSLYLQVGFVFIGGQAGSLFDVRQIKQLFPRVVSGFAIGFMVGGFLAAPLVSLSGKSEDLLVAAIVSLLATLGLLLLISRLFAAELNAQTTQERKQPPQALGRLLRKPFVLLIFVYQMLSAIGTQLIDFMLYERAAVRYAESVDLAQFIGNFTALLNLVDILFLALAAGYLVSRFGLSFGLIANPAGVGLFVIGMLLSALWLGPTSLLFFILIGAARITDITLTDGTTRTALNAAYQALPPAERVAVQMGVEGVGVPIALGLTGVILLIFQAIPSLTIFHLVLLIVGIILVWTLLGWWVYRGYATSLLHGLQNHTLVDSELSLQDSSSLAVVERLIASQQLSDVQLGLDLLMRAEHPALVQHLPSLMTNTNPAIQSDALKRIEQLRLKTALPAVENVLQTSTDSAVRGVALRTLSALYEGDAVPVIAPYLDHADTELRTAALVGLLRYGGIPGVLTAGEHLMALQRQADPASRRRAAQVIGEVAVQQFYQPLQSLLQDENLSVRQAAINAAAQVRHAQLLPLLFANLGKSETRTATTNALAAYGDEILPFVTQALAGTMPIDASDLLALVQLCGQLRSTKAQFLLQQHVGHADRLVGFAVLVALQTTGYRASGETERQLGELLQADSTHSLRILQTQQDLGSGAELTVLQHALADELGLLRRRIFRILALTYSAPAILRAEQQLLTAPENTQALAVEMLDVTLTSTQKELILPLINPRLTIEQRIQQLSKANSVALNPLPREQRLDELIADPEGKWNQTWLRTSAVYAAGLLSLESCRPAITALSNSPDSMISETAQWALNRLKSTTQSI